MPRALAPKDPNESVLVRFDFSRSATSVSNAVASVAVISGEDATPAAILVGDPIISGAFVDQRVAGGLDGVNYSIGMQTDTDDGDTLMLAGLLPVRSKLTETC